MKTCLSCQCGQFLGKRDVMQQCCWAPPYGPRYIYLKYRCSRCKKLGEHYVKQDEWDETLLNEIPLELSDGERTRFRRLGEIAQDELRAFQYSLRELNEIAAEKED